MSKLTLVFGNKNYSSWSLRPWIFLKYFNVPFEEKRIALFTDTMEKELESYFSDSKVPVLVDDGFLVWDSISIMEYLSEKFLEGKGWPADVKARAMARSISAEMHSSFSAMRAALPMNCRKKFSNYEIKPDAQHDIDRIKALWQKCRTEFGAEGDWLFGDFSIADAMYAPVVMRFAGYDVPLNKLERTYVQTVLNHPAIIEWIEVGRQEREVIAMDEIEV